MPGGSTPPAAVQLQPEPLMGATVRQIYDAATQSAVGLGDLNGLYLQSVPTTSYAYGQGLRQLDVIRKVNTTAVTDRDSFWTAYNKLAPGSTVTVELWRSQAATTVTFVKPTAPQQYNNTAGVTYTGAGWAWRGSAAGGAGSFMNDIAATSTVGDSFSYAFNGAGVSFLTETNSDEGQIDLYIDGTFKTTVDASGTPRAYQQTLYSVSGLTSGVHTIKGVMKTGQYMIVDGFTVTSAGAGAGTGANDDDPAITYSGSGWFDSNNRGMGDSGDDVHATQTNGDAFSYSFTGTGVSYVTEKYSDEGLVDVYLDNVFQTSVDTSSATRLTQQAVYTATGLTPGAHTLRVVKKSGSYMLLDRINVIS
jgi:hypothetical protein